MAEPACPNADRAGADGGEAGKPGDAAVQRALIMAAYACALAVSELAARPGEQAALDMAELTLGAMENLGEAARARAVGAAVVEAERARAYAAGYADGKAEQRRLRAVSG